MIARSLLVLVAFSVAACSKDVPSASEEKSEKPAAQAAETPAAEVADKAVKTEAKPAADEELHDKFAKVEINDVEKLLNDKKAVVVDANGDDTRQELGTVPGAVLLSNPRTFAMTELPEDKSTELIFYCGSEKCMAAPKAAARAEAAGYASVKVMPAGIRGWVKAGKPVEKS